MSPGTKRSLMNRLNACEDRGRALWFAAEVLKLMDEEARDSARCDNFPVDHGNADHWMRDLNLMARELGGAQ